MQGGNFRQREELLHLFRRHFVKRGCEWACRHVLTGRIRIYLLQSGAPAISRVSNDDTAVTRHGLLSSHLSGGCSHDTGAEGDLKAAKCCGDTMHKREAVYRFFGWNRRDTGTKAGSLSSVS